MSKFNPEDYRPVQERINQFHIDNPDGSITTEVISDPNNPNLVVVKATVYPTLNDRPVFSDHAIEVAGSSPRDGANYGFHVENACCVPLTVRALTREGWRFYHQIHAGDQLLGYNQETEELEWTTVSQVQSFNDQPLVQIGNSRFSAVATPDHKWVTSRGLVPWNEITTMATSTITLAAPISARGGNQEAAAQLAWLFTDGEISFTNGLPCRAEIRQSKEENFGELTGLFGQPREANNDLVREWGDGRVASPCRPAMIWTVRAQEVRVILGHFRVAHEQDLPGAMLRMTRDELSSFLRSAMNADGSRETFTKTHRSVVDAVQLAMFLTGHATSSIEETVGNSMTTKPCYTVSQHKKGTKYLSEFTERKLPPQPVWCPTTDLGTWIANFNGRFSITGNTSAIGRALADMGYATSATDRPSREEMEKVNRLHDNPPQTHRSTPAPSGGGEPLMSPAQERLLGMLMTRNDINPTTVFDALSDDEGTTLITKREASAWIDFMDQKKGVPHELLGFVNR